MTSRLLLLALLGLVPVMLMPGWTSALIVAAVIIIVAVVDFFLVPPPRLVSLQRTPGPMVRLGDPTDATLTVVNDSPRRLRLAVRDAWSPSAGAKSTRSRFDLAPGEDAQLVTQLLPVRRGALHGDKVTVRSRSILGFISRQRSFDVPAIVRVLPPFISRRELPSKTQKLRELDGRSAVMIRGMGTEFDSLRDYVDGDDVRSIDWRASARAQDLVVKTWRPERDRRVVIVVDSSRLAARRCGDGTVFDAALESALLLTALASGAGDRVDVVVADARIRAIASSHRSKDPVHDLSVALTTVHPELYDADWEQISSTVLATSRQHALVVLVTALDEGSVSDEILPVLPTLLARHRVVLASVEDPGLRELAAKREGTDEIFTAAAAESELLTSKSLQTRLRGAGVQSVEAAPDDLPGALADLYINLKATGKL
ncbi:Uncharacterized conserved protein, DUF58 family, contains vWF domain [Brevibacterium sandarakinum]|uniref:Uncharacterized conserved protein, DUF58 family, contains vWF domain n=1 Tax=Brevibacterium sandarakinum TaxID=629680 RepID=A0A1H1LII4_BRESA|nr:DUF58 domain-containing protein [Brevibacterium sandarakinum]SDR74353.1 Uncharacterized conserved protein, DUF58 family, contains vWF domain [Brevibacterium sandarakinum]